MTALNFWILEKKHSQLEPTISGVTQREEALNKCLVMNRGWVLWAGLFPLSRTNNDLSLGDLRSSVRAVYFWQWDLWHIWCNLSYSAADSQASEVLWKGVSQVFAMMSLYTKVWYVYPIPWYLASVTHIIHIDQWCDLKPGSSLIRAPLSLRFPFLISSRQISSAH